ncbi:MAG: hypothetical protein J7L04_01305 [Bacteroidales bacterium]|nr:hypothetical protein [Bacteroidales bacterium]
MKTKTRLFLSYFLLLLFFGYFANITLFHHSHFINSIIISHSHVQFKRTDAHGIPVKHTHTAKELIVVQSINYFITTLATGFFIFKSTLLLLNSYQIPVTNFVFSFFSQKGYNLRAPPIAYI